MLAFSTQPCGAQSGGTLLPSGPYALWSNDDRMAIERTIRRTCSAEERTLNIPIESEGRSFAGTAIYEFCLIRQMPKDWPQRPRLEEDVRSKVAAAKGYDPTISASIFAEIEAALGEIKPQEPTVHRGADPVPPGPFTSWSDTDKKTVEKNVMFGCGALAAMVYAAPPKSKEAAHEGMTAFMFSCVANAMPGDWPSMAEYRAAAAKHAAAAKRADPTLPDMMLSGNVGPKR